MKKGVDKQHLFLYYMSSSAAVHYRKQNNDAWLSLVERCVRDAEVAGSNPVASTLGRGAGKSKGFPVFLCRKKFGRALRSGRRGVHKIRWILVLNRPKRSGEPQGPVDLGFEPTEAEWRPQVQILSHRFLAGALERLAEAKCSSFFCCFLHCEMLS